MKKYKVIGIGIRDTNILDFVNNFLRNYKNFHNKLVSATGAHGIISATKDENFYNILSSFDYNLPDGQPSVWIAKLKGAKKIKRCFGPYLFKQMMIVTASKKVNHYFCGGKKGVADRLTKSCNELFNNYNIVGTYCPPFREIEEIEIQNIAMDINSKATDILWIGISTPKQELLAKRLSRYTNVKLIITIGAAFDYYTGSIKIAPPMIQKFGLEWLFRLILEPRRLWSRYVEIVPKFLVFGILDIFGFYKHSFER